MQIRMLLLANRYMHYNFDQVKLKYAIFFFIINLVFKI